MVERFETENPGEDFKPGVKYISGLVVNTLTDLGIELAD
jgi:hypothetical protein